jgi:uracil permease
MKLIYNVDDKPKFSKLVVFALQQLLAIMTATLVVPIIINSNFEDMSLNLSPSAALFGAGLGTLVYILFTRRKSPVFLGSSFAFIGSMIAAFTGAVTVAVGYLGLIIGAVLAGLVYVVIAILVKYFGVKWLNALMPAVVIGPTVALIGLSLASVAIGDLQKANAGGSPYIAILVGLVTLGVTMACATYGKKTFKLIPFIIGIASGYIFATILTVIGNQFDINALMIIDFSALKNNFAEIGLKSFISVPDFTFVTAAKGFSDFTREQFITIVVAYVPVAFVVFAEHVADHKNLSTIIEKDLIKDPGLSNTLMGDGVGSMVGAFFGGCPNTTYGESIGCVAITGNASVYSIIYAAFGAIILSFLTPFVSLINTIPSCVMGGVCMALYGFIAVSGLKMLKEVDLDEHKNLFVVSVILIAGIGGLSFTFHLDQGVITITSIAVALILGILTNVLLTIKKKSDK